MNKSEGLRVHKLSDISASGSRFRVLSSHLRPSPTSSSSMASSEKLAALSAVPSDAPTMFWANWYNWNEIGRIEIIWPFHVVECSIPDLNNLPFSSDGRRRADWGVWAATLMKAALVDSKVGPLVRLRGGTVAGRIIAAETAKEACDILKIEYKGSTKVIAMELQRLWTDYELLRMKPATLTIEESKDLTSLALTGLIGSLKSHEDRLLRDVQPVEQALQNKMTLKPKRDWKALVKPALPPGSSHSQTVNSEKGKSKAKSGPHIPVYHLTSHTIVDAPGNHSGGLRISDVFLDMPLDEPHDASRSLRDIWYFLSSYFNVDVLRNHLDTRRTFNEFFYTPLKEHSDRLPLLRDIQVITRLTPRECVVSIVFVVRHLHVLHKPVQRRINTGNESYKSHADNQRREHVFHEEEQVMVRFRAKRPPRGPAKNLSVRQIGPYTIMMRIRANVYKLDMPKSMGIHPIYNFEDLTPCYEPLDFDKIIKKEIPANVVYEDDKFPKKLEGRQESVGREWGRSGRRARIRRSEESPRAAVSRREPSLVAANRLCGKGVNSKITNRGGGNLAEERHIAILGYLLYAAKIVARQEGLDDGYRIVINDGPHGCLPIGLSSSYSSSRRETDGLAAWLMISHRHLIL
ncbi:14 kDa zinc-binding protein [Platanthera zijinensis]|uniref:14 kDa zinc-binding protein n=1 Tax=Platanthera zijinensis TaxID=2320716 RepID=A0AAP0G7V0_9ASPA